MSALSRWLIAICVLNLGDAVLNLGAERYSLGWYAARALGFVCLSALLVVLVVELGRIDARTDRAATTDALTGLANRTAALEQIIVLLLNGVDAGQNFSRRNMVAGLAGAVDVEQGAAHPVVADLAGAVAHVGHVAVGAGHGTL